MEKLSIIVPIYNGAKRIEKCIQSILQQTYSNLELILIDDGSKDDSYEIAKRVLEEAGQQNVEVKLLHQENQGVANTRNYGISIASGKYVTFVDQDDYILPQYCETYMLEAERTDADIVVGGFQRITDEGKITRTVSLTQGEWSKFVVTAPWAHIYRTEFLRQNEIQFLSTKIGEDIYFNITAYAYTKKIAILADHSYMWVDNPKSVSNSKQNFIHEGNNPLYLLDSLIERLPKENCIGHEYEEYFFMRYIVWYFSFTVRGSKKSDVKDMYIKLLSWLETHFPEYKRNPNIRMGRPKGDSFAIRVSVWLFYTLKKIGILLKCLSFLAQRDERR